MLSAYVEHPGQAYISAVIAPLASLQAQHAEAVRATTLGILGKLMVAAVGGWWIGRQTLKPLKLMAGQARAINERNPTERQARIRS